MGSRGRELSRTLAGRAARSGHSAGSCTVIRLCLRPGIRPYTLLPMTHSDTPSWPVRAALEILDEDGFRAVSVRAVAARAGRTPMAVYRHVEDVDDLSRVVVRQVFEHWESQVYGLLEEEAPMARLERYADLYAAYERDHPHRYDVLFVLRHGIGTHRFPDGFDERAASTFQILRDAVAETLAAGVDAPRDDRDPTEIALGLWATAHGLVMLRRSGRFPDRGAFDDFYRRTVARLLENLTGASRVDRPAPHHARIRREDRTP